MLRDVRIKLIYYYCSTCSVIYFSQSNTHNLQIQYTFMLFMFYVFTTPVVDSSSNAMVHSDTRWGSVGETVEWIG